MTLREARVKFTEILPKLINHAFELGFEAAVDDVKATTGHMPHSLHYDGLAVDLLLYKNGEYLTNTDDYLELGEYWEGLDTCCAWGGRFGAHGSGKADGNHFSYCPQEVVGNRK